MGAACLQRRGGLVAEHGELFVDEGLARVGAAGYLQDLRGARGSMVARAAARLAWGVRFISAASPLKRRPCQNGGRRHPPPPNDRPIDQELCLLKRRSRPEEGPCGLSRNEQRRPWDLGLGRLRGVII